MSGLRKGILTSLANNAHVDNMVHSDCEPAGRKLCCEMTADDEGNIDRQTWSKWHVSWWDKYKNDIDEFYVRLTLTS